MAAVLERGRSNCTGVSLGGLNPILWASNSTYEADPIPRISEMVFPSAAAAIVDIEIIAPRDASMCSPCKATRFP